MAKKFIAVAVRGFYEVDTDSEAYEGRDPIEVDKKALDEGDMGIDDLLGVLDDVEYELAYFDGAVPDAREQAVDDIKNVRLDDLAGTDRE